MNKYLEYYNKIHFSSLPLSENQIQIIAQINEKINSGRYILENCSCICGNDYGILLSTCDRYGLLVHTMICSNCGILWTNPRLSEDSLKQFYQSEYRILYSDAIQPTSEFFDDQVKHGVSLQKIIKKIGLNEAEKGTIFDIGCGAGGVLLPFFQTGWDVYGCDLNSEYLNYGRNEGLKLISGNYHELIPYGPADIIILSHVLEHISNPLEFLISIREKILKDDGYLVIELPGVLSIRRTYGSLLLFLQNAHLYHFTLDSLSNLMQDAGYHRVWGNERVISIFKNGRDNQYKRKNPHWKIKLYLMYLYYYESGKWNRIMKGRIWKLLP